VPDVGSMPAHPADVVFTLAVGVSPACADLAGSELLVPPPSAVCPRPVACVFSKLYTVKEATGRDDDSDSDDDDDDADV